MKFELLKERDNIFTRAYTHTHPVEEEEAAAAGRKKERKS